jgi:hypothetical protein
VQDVQYCLKYSEVDDDDDEFCGVWQMLCCLRCDKRAVGPFEEIVDPAQKNILPVKQ